MGAAGRSWSGFGGAGRLAWVMTGTGRTVGGSVGGAACGASSGGAAGAADGSSAGVAEALGARRAVRMDRFARIAWSWRLPLNAPVLPHNAATAGQAIDGIVVFAEWGEVLGVSVAAVAPFGDVVNLGVVRTT